MGSKVRFSMPYIGLKTIKEKSVAVSVLFGRIKKKCIDSWSYYEYKEQVMYTNIYIYVKSCFL